MIGVRVRVSVYNQTDSDSSGHYYAVLGHSRDAVDVLTFSHQGYADGIASLDTATVVREYLLEINFGMRHAKARH